MHLNDVLLLPGLRSVEYSVAGDKALSDLVHGQDPSPGHGRCGPPIVDPHKGHRTDHAGNQGPCTAVGVVWDPKSPPQDQAPVAREDYTPFAARDQDAEVGCLVAESGHRGSTGGAHYKGLQLATREERVA